jgi:hypothetical protein
MEVDFCHSFEPLARCAAVGWPDGVLRMLSGTSTPAALPFARGVDFGVDRESEVFGIRTVAPAPRKLLPCIMQTCRGTTQCRRPARRTGRLRPAWGVCVCVGAWFLTSQRFCGSMPSSAWRRLWAGKEASRL